MGGIALGGLASGFTDTSRMLNEQARTAIYGRQQQAQEQLQLLQEAQKSIGDMVAHASDIAKSVADQGGDPTQLGQNPAFQSLVQGAMRTASLTNGRIDPQAVQAQFQTILQRPPVPETFKVQNVPNQQSIMLPNVPVQEGSRGTVRAMPQGIPGVTAPSQGSMLGGMPGVAPGEVIGTPGQSSETAQPAPIPTRSPMVKQLLDSGQIDLPTLDFNAERYLRNEKVATGFRGKPGQLYRNALEARSAELAIAKGMTAGDVNAAQAQTKANTKALSQLTSTRNAIEQYENTAIANGDALVNLAQKVDTTGRPVFERWIRAGRQAIAGDPDVSNFNLQLQLYRAEVAKIMTNPNLTGVLTDTARAEVSKGLANDASFAQVKAAHDLLKQDFQRRNKALSDQIQHIISSFSGALPQKGQAPAAAPASQAPSLQDLKNKYGLQ